MIPKTKYTADGTSRAIPDRVADRAATNYVIDRDGCWITQYSSGSHGYGQIGWRDGDRRHTTTTQRAAWTHHFGPIPDGMTVDHRCRVLRCVNPAHLRLKTNVENSIDNGQTRTRVGVGRPCRRGLHELVQGRGPKASCRDCALQRRRERRARATP